MFISLSLFMYMCALSHMYTFTAHLHVFVHCDDKKQMLTHRSSLNGSALTCGVSTDLLNTAPSAPEITEHNIRQEAAVN